MLSTLTLGWELETEGPYDDQDEACDVAQDFASLRLGRALREVKEDCSLDDGGAEIVSEPRTFAEWQALRVNVEALLGDLRRDGWRSWDGGNCGGHIHVGRDQISAEGLVRLMDLIYETGNQRFWKRLSGRRNHGEWCTFNVSLETMRSYAERAKGDEYWCSMNRTAVHMSSHNTVEFRLWRGTLNFERFWRNLEATHAACSFSELAQDQPTTTDAFSEYVAQHAASYPLFAAHLANNLSTIGA